MPKQKPTMSEPDNSDESAPMGSDDLASPEADFRTMQRAIRSWAGIIIILNIIHLLTPVNYQVYYAYWLLLIILGITTFVFRSSLMMIVISTFVITEGVTQVLLGAEFGGFFVFAVVYIVGSLFLYVRYNKNERSYRGVSGDSTSDILTWQDLGRRLSVIAPIIGILGFSSSFTVVMFTGLIGINQWLPAVSFYLTLLEIGGLSLGVGIAAFAAGTPRRWLATAGIIVGLLLWFWEMISAVYWE